MIDWDGVLTNATALPEGSYWIRISVNDPLGHTTSTPFKVLVQEPNIPSNGNPSANELLVILGIVGIVGAVGLPISLMGIILVKRKRSEGDQT